METINFRNCTTEFVEDTFNLTKIKESNYLNNWFVDSKNIEISDFETQAVLYFQTILNQKVLDWNEYELSEQFIGPLISLVNFNTHKFSAFVFRQLKGQIGDYILSGEPDLMIATGRSQPKIPYFCFQEFKRSFENPGEPQGQVLASMLIAQEQNVEKHPIYGIYVIGKYWHFLVLHKNEYVVSKSFTADDEEIFDIFKLLKQLKNIIIQSIENK